MTTEITEYTGRSFTDLIQEFSKAQQDYLYLRVMGFPIKRAMELSDRKKDTVKVWRLDDPRFKCLEEYLVSNCAVYREEALTYFNQFGGDSIHYGLMSLAEKINDWASDSNSVPQRDKPYIMRAVEIISKMRSGSSKNEGYEEWLMRIRRKVD